MDRMNLIEFQHRLMSLLGIVIHYKDICSVALPVTLIAPDSCRDGVER